LGRYSSGNPRQSGKWQGNAPRPQQADTQAVKDLKAKLSKARMDLKAERLGKRPSYTQVAAPISQPVAAPAPQPGCCPSRRPCSRHNSRPQQTKTTNWQKR
jgi:hypothetical protein